MIGMDGHGGKDMNHSSVLFRYFSSLVAESPLAAAVHS
jgi:hypothetical protein